VGSSLVMRYRVTDRVPGTVKKGAEPVPDGPATFPTRWFHTKEQLYESLNA
jgi:hypothetical protein